MYAKKLPYAQWFDFNQRQRVHYNAFEAVVFVTGLTLVAGLWLPKYTLVVGSIIYIGRLVYSIGYMKDPKMRAMGAPLMVPGYLLLIGGALYSSLKLAMPS